jgi:hypothetical protein
MKRWCIVLLAVGAMVAGLVPPSWATIAFSQQVNLRNDPTDSTGFVLKYTSFPDGYDNCGYTSGQPNPNPCTPQIGSGKIRVIPRTYKLVEENKKKDFYLIDLTISMFAQDGSKDFGYLDVTVSGASKVRAATYSLGKSTVDGCKRYPINVAAGWGPLSAGTTVGSFSVNCYSTSIARQAVSGGQAYHVTNLNAVKSVTFQRFAIVKKGVEPTFRYRVSRPTDRCATSTVSNGSTQHTFRSCTNSSKAVVRTIQTDGND